jgi:hypothetical protein
MKGVWDRVEGFQVLVDWFGEMPSFHDGQMLSLTIDFPDRAMFQVHAWRITDQVDGQGYFVHDKDFVATFRLEEVSLVDLETDYQGPGIVNFLELAELDEVLELTIYSVLGAGGRLRAGRIAIDFQPGKPA